MKRTWILALVGASVAAAAWGGTVLARTTDTGYSGTTIAKGTYGSLSLRGFQFAFDPTTKRPNIWVSQLRTVGDSDLYVQSNTWQPGASTGWHTHPGWSLIMVTSGSVTAYEGDDPGCTPHVYTAGQSFTDPGGGHVHLIRNESDQIATGVAVQMIPAGATRTEKVASPGNCSF